MSEPTRDTLLRVRGLSVTFDVAGGEAQATEGVTFDIAPAETVAVVGESGSGKSVTAYAIVGLLAKNGRVTQGDITFAGRLLSPAAAGSLRGREIAFIFQNPRAALNPIRAVGDQIVDCLVAAGRTTGPRAILRSQAVELLDKVRINDAKARYWAYPHELSGGMCQRVLIAMALAAQPKLLIADEPTTGLDVTTQRVVMDLLAELAIAGGMATLLITHDLGLAAEYCSRIIVMQKGRVVERGAADRIVEAPKHAYTQRLVSATPRPGRALIDLLPEAEREPFRRATGTAKKISPAVGDTSDVPLLEVDGLSHSFDLPSRFGRLMDFAPIGPLRFARSQQASRRYAVRDVRFKLQEGEALGIVGESGSGKTTTSRMVAGLLSPETGQIRFEGADVASSSPSALARSDLRRRIQFVFQDPQGSLNPRFTAYQAIANPLGNFTLPDRERAGASERARVHWAAEKAGLDLTLLGRFPHQLSGGQQARIGIARALVLEPDLLILDEPTSALDMSVQALVLNQLDLLRRELGLAFIFVSHDLHVVRLLCDRVLVMRHGEVVEAGPVAEVFSNPSHPYTRELLDAIPGGHRRKAQLRAPQPRSMEDQECPNQPA